MAPIGAAADAGSTPPGVVGRGRSENGTVAGSATDNAGPTMIDWVPSIALTKRRSAKPVASPVSSGNATMRSAVVFPPIRTSVTTGSPFAASPTATDVALEVGFTSQDEPAGTAS